MNSINKTLYIPLYGKAFVSKKGIIINDPKAEELWSKEGFNLKRKSKSKWLAYYMAMRAKAFDNWVKEKLTENKNAIVLHIGCGLDSRVERINAKNTLWYDIDFENVINERKKYYTENNNYYMTIGDATKPDWIYSLPKNLNAIIILEGISMYLQPSEIKILFNTISKHFNSACILMDCYTTFSAKVSKYKNPINDVGVTKVYGVDNPTVFQSNSIHFIKEHTITPIEMINQLPNIEKQIFKLLYAGKLAKRMYKLYEYSIDN